VDGKLKTFHFIRSNSRPGPDDDIREESITPLDAAVRDAAVRDAAVRDANAMRRVGFGDDR